MAGPLGDLVPKGELEPPRVAPHAPQTCASANSATSAPAKGEYARPPSILSISGRPWVNLLRHTSLRTGRQPSTYTHVRLGLPARSRLVWLVTCPSACCPNRPTTARNGGGGR